MVHTIMTVQAYTVLVHAASHVSYMFLAITPSGFLC